MPTDSLNEPARTLLRRTALITRAAVFLGLVLALVSGLFLTKGLKEMTIRAGKAGDLDFGRPEARAFFEKDPLSQRSDEAGRLAAAFDRMGLALAQKVEELLEAADARARVRGELAAVRGIQPGMLPSPGEASRDPFSASAFLLPA